jgi:hypothetical protein
LLTSEEHGYLSDANVIAPFVCVTPSLNWQASLRSG